MDGFKGHFSNAEKIYYESNVNFHRFREHEDTYGFLLTNGELDFNAMKRAYDIDSTMFSQYLSVRKSDLGYGNRIKYKLIDQCDSRHIMMSTFIFSKNKNYKNILEIGGGYGNWYRLNRNLIDFNKWIIIDLPFCLDLQKWYLERETGDLKKLDFRSAYDYTIDESIDLVIAAHSLSELSWEDFDDYYKKVLMKTKQLFYAGHRWNCGADLLQRKLEKLDQDFDLIDTFLEENDTVYNNLYMRKI
tara:strand:+ start:80 stop:814 length:735 start_codon:yes stop_codon:yes gene_type:complete